MIELSVDIGFGDTKYILKKDGVEIKKEKFNTIIERVSLNLKNKQDVYNYRGEISYFRVGNKNAKNPYKTRSMEFIIKNAPLIIYHILDKNDIKLDENEVLNIRTGLSPLYYEAYKDSFKKTIKEFTVNGKTIKTNLKLFAQGQGILFDYLENNSNNDREKDIIVIDCGYHIVNFLHFEKEDGIFKPIKGDSFGEIIGIYSTIITYLQDYIEVKFNIKITEQEALQIFFQNKIKIKDEEINLSNIINELTLYYLDTLENDILNIQMNLIVKANRIIFGGGGAYFLDEDELKKMHKKSIIVKDPEFSNVRGYLNKK